MDDVLLTDMFSYCFWLLVEGNQVPTSPGSLASVIGSVGLKDVDLREDGSELAAKLLNLLTGDFLLDQYRLTTIPHVEPSTFYLYSLCSFQPFCQPKSVFALLLQSNPFFSAVHH